MNSSSKTFLIKKIRENFMVNESFLEVLKKDSLLEKLEHLRDVGELCKIFPSTFSRRKHYREVRAFKLNSSLEFYVKQYNSNINEAEKEWKNIILLWSKGFPSSIPIFFKKNRNYAFIGTKKISGINLIELISDNPDKATHYIKKIATFMGRFHKESLFHQDCYLNHFYIDLEKDEVYILDVSRVLHEPFFSLYYQIKDLAQLKFSFLEYFREHYEKLWNLFLEEYCFFHRISKLKKLMIVLKFHRIKAHTQRIERYKE